MRRRFEMKNAPWLVLALAATPLLSACSKDPGQGFEGEIDMTETTVYATSPATVRYFIKGERVRIETTAAKMTTTTIVDISTNDIFLLDDAKKSYRALTKMPAAPPATAAATTPSHSLFHRPAKSAVVAGIPCAIQSTKLATGHMETCACDGLNFPSRAWSSLFGADPSGAFVLQRDLFDTSGARIASMETDRVERAKEPSTLFEVPSGYTLVR